MAITGGVSMKLTNEHKNIIRLILEGKVDSLQSFIEYTYKSKFKIDKKVINSRKKG